MYKHVALFGAVACILAGLLGGLYYFKIIGHHITMVREVNGVHEYRLANGMQVLLLPDASTSSITVNVTYRVGSRHEGYGETGMAHLLEHMLFKGTEAYPDIDNEFTLHAANSNASTAFDRTNYFETMPASLDNLSWALSLEASRMVDSWFTKEDLEKEMPVVRNEMEGGENDPVSALSERVQSSAYMWHNYGKSTIGARSDVEGVDIERLRAFYKTYYRPDNAVLVVAGNFMVDEALTEIEASFGTLSRPKTAIPQTLTDEPDQEGEKEVVLRRVGETPQVILGYHVPPVVHADSTALAVALDVLTRSPGGVLYETFVKTGQATTVSAMPQNTKDPGYLQLSITPARGVDPRTLAQNVESVLESGQIDVKRELVDAAKKLLVQQYERVFEDAEQFALLLTEWVALGDWRLAFAVPQAYARVSADDVSRVLAKYFVPTNRTRGLLYPSKEKPVTVTLASSSSSEIEARASVVADSVVDVGEEFDTSIGNIQLQTHLDTVADVPAAFVHKQTRGNRVALQIALDYGDETSLYGTAAVSRLAGSLVGRATKRLDEHQLQDTWVDLDSRVSMQGSGTSLRVSLSSDDEHVASALALLKDVLREPNVPDEMFEQEVATQIQALEESRTNVQARVYQRLAEHFATFPKTDIRGVQTVDEQIAALKKVTKKDVEAYWKKFYTPVHAQVAVVGDYDYDAVRAGLVALFSGWRGGGAARVGEAKYARLSLGPIVTKSLRESIPVDGKADAAIAGSMSLPMRDDDKAYPALVLASQIFGGHGLDSRLMARIREKDGLSYGVSASFGADPFERYATFAFEATAAPENSQKVIDAFFEELERVRKDGFTSGEVERAQHAFIESEKAARGTNEGIADFLVTMLYTGKTFDDTRKFEDAVSHLTPEELREAVQRYWVPGQMAVVRAGSFK